MKFSDPESTREGTVSRSNSLIVINWSSSNSRPLMLALDTVDLNSIPDLASKQIVVNID
jgi:hypothetical protein